MKTLLKKIKILHLKHRAKHNYAVAMSFYNYLDCGRQMAEILRPDIAIARRKFNSIMDQLETLGEDVPKLRL